MMCPRTSHWQIVKQAFHFLCRAGQAPEAIAVPAHVPCHENDFQIRDKQTLIFLLCLKVYLKNKYRLSELNYYAQLYFEVSLMPQ